MPALAIPIPRHLPLPERRKVLIPTLALILAAALGWALLTLPATLALPGRAALLAMALAMLGWTCTRLPESLVALAAVLGLVLQERLPLAVLAAALTALALALLRAWRKGRPLRRLGRVPFGAALALAGAMVAALA